MNEPRSQPPDPPGSALDSEDPCAARLRVLAHRTRLAVVEALMRGPLHVGELATALVVEQSLLSHHLKILRDAGLVEADRDGKSVRYGLAEGIEGDGDDKSIHLGCCRLSFEADDR